MEMAAQVYRDSDQTDIERGDMLKFDRDGKFLHYAVYIGRGKVIHQTKNKGVLEQELKDVICRSLFYIDRDLDPELGPKEQDQIVKNAKSKIGRPGYCMFTSNCEHFATWCRYGKAICRQIREKAAQIAGFSSSSSPSTTESFTDVLECLSCSNGPQEQ